MVLELGEMVFWKYQTVADAWVIEEAPSNLYGQEHRVQNRILEETRSVSRFPSAMQILSNCQRIAEPVTTW